MRSISNDNTIIEEYLEMTGQTFQELMSGATSYGMDYIISLAEKALRENKKIVWKDGPGFIDSMSFELRTYTIK